MYMHWFLKSQFHLQEKKEVLVQEKKKAITKLKTKQKKTATIKQIH